MEKEKAKKLSELLLAYSNDKIIQIFKGDEWIDISGELLNTQIEFELIRIKPEPKLVPFTRVDHELFKDKWVKLG